MTLEYAISLRMVDILQKRRMQRTRSEEIVSSTLIPIAIAILRGDIYG